MYFFIVLEAGLQPALCCGLINLGRWPRLAVSQDFALKRRLLKFHSV